MTQGVIMNRKKTANRKRKSTSGYRRPAISRRTLLLGAAAGAAAAGSNLFPVPQIVRAQARRLTILHWSHFVPAFDKWFDGEYTKEWGRTNGVEVVVDHIPSGQVAVRAAAEVSARKGHDLYQ